MTAPDQPDDPPRRVRVTSPRTSAARTRAVAPTTEIDNRSRLGEIYLSSLLRAQARLAVRVLSVVGMVVISLPLVFRAFPQLTSTDVLNMPLPWVLLAFAIYPFLFLCGWHYVRRAEHNESAFEAMVRPPGEPDGEGDRP